MHITLFDNLDKKLFSSRNNKFLSFPFEIDIISIFRKNIVKNLLNLETKPYKLIIFNHSAEMVRDVKDTSLGELIKLLNNSAKKNWNRNL